MPPQATDRQRQIVATMDHVLDHCSAVVRAEVLGPSGDTVGSAYSLARLRPGLVAELMGLVRAFDHEHLEDRVTAARGKVGEA